MKNEKWKMELDVTEIEGNSNNNLNSFLNVIQDESLNVCNKELYQNKESDEINSKKDSALCSFCSKKIEKYLNINDKPDLAETLNQLDIIIPPIDGYSDYICCQCVFKLHCIQEYKRIWKSNIIKSRINYFYRKGDKEMVRRLIPLKPSTSSNGEVRHHLRTRSVGGNLSIVNGDDNQNEKEQHISQEATSTTTEVVDRKKDCVANIESVNKTIDKISNEKQNSNDRPNSKNNEIISKMKLRRSTTVSCQMKNSNSIMHERKSTTTQRHQHQHKRSISLNEKILNSSKLSSKIQIFVDTTHLQNGRTNTENEIADANYSTDESRSTLLNGFKEPSLHINDETTDTKTTIFSSSPIKKRKNRNNHFNSNTIQNNEINTSLEELNNSNNSIEISKTSNSKSNDALNTSEENATEFVCEIAPHAKIRAPLNIMYEENEPAALTESGGQISSRVSLTPYVEVHHLKCKYCDRVYKRETFLIKHERKHERNRQKAISISSSRASLKILGITYNCPDCGEVFPTKLKLSKHKKQHSTRIKCQYCQKEFFLKNDADFHESICLGVQMAKDMPIISNDIDSSTYENLNQSKQRYYTRSATSKKLNTIKKTDQIHSNERHHNVKNKYHHCEQRKHLSDGEDDLNYDDENTDDELSDTTEIDSLFSSRMRNTKNWAEKIKMDYEIDDDDEDLNTEVADIISLSTDFDDIITINSSVYSEESDSEIRHRTKRRRTRFVDVKTNPLPYDNFDAELDYNESFHSEAIFHFIKCQFESCPYQNTKLEAVMEHDRAVHGVTELYYYCKKCKGSFSRKCYYDFHCKNQDSGCFICNKCHAEFSYEELLREHLDEHRIVENYGEIHDCQLCKMIFLTKNDLIRHLATSKHLKSKQAPKITIKIRNSYPVENIEKQINDSNDINSKNLFSKIKILKLRKSISKNFKYPCFCLTKNCFDCQKHRRMLKSFGKEPKPTRHYKRRSCNEIKIPPLHSRYFLHNYYIE